MDVLSSLAVPSCAAAALPGIRMPSGAPPPAVEAPAGLAALERRALHELYAARESDAAAMIGVALGLALRAAGSRPVLWVRHCALDGEAGEPYPAGLHEFGVDLARIITVSVRDAAAGLQAGLEGARSAGLGGVLIALRGKAPAYDLTASRRLALASRASDLPVYLLRMGATPQASAAETRWEVRGAPSQPLQANAPGRPGFALNLLRARNGASGTTCHVEWDRDVRAFIRIVTRGDSDGLPVLPPASGAALHRPLAAFALDRSLADDTRSAYRRASG